MKTTRIFIHGLESTSYGTKGEFFRKKYPGMILEDFTGPLKRRMDKLNDILCNKTDLILVGSSYGGLMATVYTCENEQNVKRLILLAPALNLPDFEPYLDCPLRIPVVLYHGRYDDVVPPETVHAISTKKFSNLVHHLVDDDHSLHHTFSNMNWDDLLII
jgi:pimeloyl-ACP methyl ester carboxylesterase